MTRNTKAGSSKIDFLLAMRVGESYSFDNLPTAAEGRRKVPPSMRKAYGRITQAVRSLHRIHPEYEFLMRLDTSKGSRIEGDKLVVTMIKDRSEVTNEDDLRELEARRQRSIEAWRLRKIAEDAPKLPGQLKEAQEREDQERVRRAVARAMPTPAAIVVGPKYDPKRLAELVLGHAQGRVVQVLTEHGWRDAPAPSWELPTTKYRFKPQRREFYIVLGRDGSITTVQDDPTKLPPHDPTCLVKAVEVLPEEDE